MLPSLRNRRHPSPTSPPLPSPRRHYSPEEWAWICAMRQKRGSPVSDGVADALEREGFTNCFDAAVAAAEEEEEKGGNGFRRNWDGPLPPPTHWTSTNIDHCYGRGLEVRGVYVVPSVLSDHLPVVTDWVLSVK